MQRRLAWSTKLKRFDVNLDIETDSHYNNQQETNLLRSDHLLTYTTNAPIQHQHPLQVPKTLNTSALWRSIFHLFSDFNDFGNTSSASTRSKESNNLLLISELK